MQSRSKKVLRAEQHLFATANAINRLTNDNVPKTYVNNPEMKEKKKQRHTQHTHTHTRRAELFAIWWHYGFWFLLIIRFIFILI